MFTERGKTGVKAYLKGSSKRRKDLDRIVAVKIEKGRQLYQIFKSRVCKNLSINCL